jgi:hypothetical protein
MINRQATYDDVVARIDDTPELEPYRALLLFDWQEEQEHYEWATGASVQEIVDWAESIRADDDLQRLEEDATADYVE